jgi:hypothetical protein
MGVRLCEWLGGPAFLGEKTGCGYGNVYKRGKIW